MSTATGTAATRSLRSLIGHIIAKHHVYLRQELPRQEEIIGKMTANHGNERPVLFSIQQLLQDLRDDISAHLLKEEQILFPYVEGLEAAETEGGEMPHACFPTVRGPIRVMFMEHDQAQSILKELRAATGNYTPPKDSTCDCAKKFYQGLADLESDLLEHIRVENEELFPRAIELEERTAAWQ